MSNKAITEAKAREAFGDVVCRRCQHYCNRSRCFIEGIDEYIYSAVDGEISKNHDDCFIRNVNGKCEHFKQKQGGC